MASRVDLDEARRLLCGGPTLTASVQDAERLIALALIAEVRDAREVIRLAPRPPWFNAHTREYVAALAAYDRHDQAEVAG